MIIDNVNRKLKDDLKETIKPRSKISMAAAFFSMYAFKELKEELSKIESFDFIFTSPTFMEDSDKKDKKQFYIPSLGERSIYGTEFEIKLKNELGQKRIASECAEWIRKKARFKTNITERNLENFMNVDESNYTRLKGFTTVDLGCEKGNDIINSVSKADSAEDAKYFIKIFNELWNDEKLVKDVTEEVIESITVAYNENSPRFMYFFTLYNIFREFLEDITEDELPNEDVGFKDSKIWSMLYNFQRDAVIGIINKLEKYNGCILADSVGLGKTFTALAVIKYYEERNKSVLVLCPKKLSENWNTYKANYINNPISEDRLRYDVLYHTDLSRKDGMSNSIDLARLNWGNYDLIVIDESHNFRNGGKISEDDGKMNRYSVLMERAIKSGIKTKVLMLSATPVNNKFMDLKNQIALSYEGDAEKLNKKLGDDKDIDEIFKDAQSSFNKWRKLDEENRTTDNLLKMLDFDFFEILDSVTIARSRKHIQKYYNTNAIGQFPERLKPISMRPDLTDLKEAINYNEIYKILTSLNLLIYAPSKFILESKKAKYVDLHHNLEDRLTQIGREEGIRSLMSVNLLKRLESSVYSFRLTAERIKNYVEETIDKINRYESSRKAIDICEVENEEDLDIEDSNREEFVVGKKVKISIEDMDYIGWRNELERDKEHLELLCSMIADISPKYDTKLKELYKMIDNKIENPINDSNKKIIVFTAFSDTADYLYENISTYVKKKYGLHTAEITGSTEGKSTVPKLKASLNNVLTCFSPESKDKKVLMPDCKDEIDILIATDCISEGQNLQDCDYLINYDIHWNPVRIVQRFGRIDRIGSKNRYIQMVNFWPNMDLDEYINLKSRVEERMRVTSLTSTGDDDLINEEEKGDLEYRRKQLKRLQQEVVDLEEMGDGISIMDLGLNEYRMDLLEYLKEDVNLAKYPNGMHAVVEADEENPRGVIFVLKNINDSINKDKRNRIHPFYIVYVDEEGEVVCDYLKPKEMLDRIKILGRENDKPIKDICAAFNKETKDGKYMKDISMQLDDSINSIINTKETKDVQSLFGAGGTTALRSKISGIDDFELISFFVVR